MTTQPSHTNLELSNKEAGLTRAEWIAAAALAISIIQGAYVAGVEVQRLNDHDRRLSSIETAQGATQAKIEQLLITTARIDANVEALAERSKEQRAGGRSR